LDELAADLVASGVGLADPLGGIAVGLAPDVVGLGLRVAKEFRCVDSCLAEDGRGLRFETRPNLLVRRQQPNLPAHAWSIAATRQ
jgi:hypothetical protein